MAIPDSLGAVGDVIRDAVTAIAHDIAGAITAGAKAAGKAAGAVAGGKPPKDGAFVPNPFLPEAFAASEYVPSDDPNDVAKENANRVAYNKQEAKRYNEHQEKEAARKAAHEKSEAERKKAHDAKAKAAAKTPSPVSEDKGRTSLKQLGALIGGLAGPAGMALSALGPLSNVFTMFSDVVGTVKDAITSSFSSMIAVMSSPIDVINSLGNAVGNLTRLANPGQFERFGLAIRDATAALGQSMEPLMESFIVIARMVGDEMARLAPSIEPAMAAFGEMAVAFTNMLMPAMELLGPVLGLYATYWKELAEIMNLLVSPMRQLVKLFADLLGITELVDKSRDNSRSAMGSAVRNFSLSTSAADLQKTAAARALSTGPSMREKVESATVQLPKLLEDILKEVKLGIAAVDAFLKSIKPMSDKELEDNGLDGGILGRIEGYLAQGLARFL